jgi:hypothetical protein
MRTQRNPFDIALSRKKRLSPLALVGLVFPLVVILVSTVVFLLPYIQTHAAVVETTPNMDCTLKVPAHPLTAQGLATPYELVATNPDKGACHEANAVQAAFVQGTIFDPDKRTVSVYNPLVIDKDTKPAINPVVPTLPKNAVVGLWFGFNGNNLTLQSSDRSLQEGMCVNGVNGSIFGQFAYCNAPAFFAAANQAFKAGKLAIPMLGTAKDGQPCLSVRDFGLVDQDQSDNVTTAYLVTKNGQIAQATAANQTQLSNAQKIGNGSDNRLLDSFVDPALGCTPWMAPDLANAGQPTPALALNELQAMAFQKDPVALVPLSDPMVLNDNKFSLDKTNVYRAGVDQIQVQDDDQADPKAYCQNLAQTGAQRIVQDASFTVHANTPDAGTGDTLFTFLAQRFVDSYANLNCQKLLGKASPIATKQNADGVAISVTFNGQAVDTNSSQSPDCFINGQKVKGCNGKVVVNGQSCTLNFVNDTVVMDCPKR